MSVIAKDIVEYIEGLAPLDLQEKWDNSGLQIGNLDQEITSITLALDLTDKLVDQAIEKKSNFIFTHHPFFFDGIKSIDYNTYKGKLIRKIIREGIFCYSAHTNLDKTVGGVNDVLANILQIDEINRFQEDGEDSIGIYGKTKLKSYDNLIEKINWNICPKEYIRILGKKHKDIDIIALVGGSGGSMVEDVARYGCDTFITGDVKHHDGQLAYENNLMVIDISHFYSELPVILKLGDKLKDKFQLNTYISKDPLWIHKL